MEKSVKKKNDKKKDLTQEELEEIFILVAKRFEKSPLGKRAGFKVVLIDKD
jgi:hypothetical protein